MLLLDEYILHSFTVTHKLVNPFCLTWTMKNLLLGYNFVSTLMLIFGMLNINLILSATKFNSKTNGSN